MNKNIHTLVNDVYELVKRNDGWFNEGIADDLSRSITRRLSEQLGQRNTERRDLRLSQMGPRCPRALWYSVHRPELAEALPPWATIKYSYGHILEALLICLAKAAGHEVTGEQDELVLDGIKGHRDCVIDGCIVDVKSASSRSFQKFKDRTLAQDDAFGYLEQLDGYVVASRDDDLVREKSRGYILAIDKTLGHMVLYEHAVRSEHIQRRIRDFKRIVEGTVPPTCTCETRTSGGGGNVELGDVAGYSAYKFCCFPQLRTCLTSKGPRYLVHVNKWPTYAGKPLPEIDRDGKIIYH